VQGQRVGADVALQVDAAQTRDVAQQRAVELDHAGEGGRVADQPAHGIPLGDRVCGSALVPVRAVDVQVVVHGRRV
jgi:hypothetical protein